MRSRYLWTALGLGAFVLATLVMIARPRVRRSGEVPARQLAASYAKEPGPNVRLAAPARLPQVQSAADIARNTFQSVVILVMQDAHAQPVSLGSGFFVRPGVIATSLHLIEGAASGYAKLVGQAPKFDIEGRVGLDEARDVALLRVSGVKAPSLSMGDSKQVAVGDEVYAVGNPGGLEGTFSQGIVSGIRNVGSDYLLQITAPVSPGSSGGPVLNRGGEVIGVAAATFQGGQNLNFAIPSSYLASLLTQMKSVTPLSSGRQPKREKSIVRKFGAPGVEGLTGENFTWDSAAILRFGDYSFSLRNRLRDPVKDVYYLAVFYDTAGNPIDVDLQYVKEIIPGALAKRVKGQVDETVEKLNSPYSGWQEVPEPPRRPKGRVEFRILDFKILQ
jgi:S1-C subfamily serine protease